MNFGLSPAQWLASLLVCIVLLSVGTQEPNRLHAESLPEPVMLPLFSASGLRSSIQSPTPLESISATSVYVLSQENGEILLEHNSNTDYAPASTTKLMTALVARQLFPLERVIDVPMMPFADERQPLVAGERYTVDELLAALLISSNNSAAYTLANAHPEGFDGFIDDMNTLATALQLNNTNFTNPAGFDDFSHRSTARDLGQLFRAAMLDRALEPYLSASTRVLRRADGSSKGQLSSTHQLLTSDDRALAGKTGTTDEARQVLITLLETRGHPYIVVVLGSTDRYSETRRLADWVDERYTWQEMNPLSLVED